MARFAAEWAGETRERAESQSFWTDLLDCFGVSRKRQGVLFERPARRASTGKVGFIDVFWPGVILAEQKSGGKLTVASDGERSNAEEQAFDYLNGGDVTEAEFPRYVLTSDFASIQITDLAAPMGDPARTITFATADLADHFERLLFLAGYQQRSFVEQDQEEASIEAARLMAALYVALTGDADTDDTIDADEEQVITLEASVLMTRLLFLMFGDDAGLWERGLFTRWVRDRTAEDGSDLGALLNGLFDWLNTREGRRDPRADPSLRDFPYVNGSLFAQREATPHFDKTMRQALLKACEFEWTRISPAVFGSLFQSIKSKAARRAAGEHYTTEENILKTLRPLFLDEYEERLARADTPGKLLNLHKTLGRLRYMDPACGCGNFLIVAYREMRRIELELLVKLRQLKGTGDVLALDATYDLRVSLDQFHGIELHWWPAKIAETAMFLVDHQANRRMEQALGLSPERFPITVAARIHHANALRTDWSATLPAGPDQTVYICGNPPFAGARLMSRDQKAELSAVWEKGMSTDHDYVTGWYAKALDYYRTHTGEWSFVSTNSITQGAAVPALFRPVLDAGWRIKFAHRTFAWTTEAVGAAAVHCVIIGFTRGGQGARLFSYATLKSKPVEIRVKSINGYLVEGPDVLVEKSGIKLAPQLPPVRFGSMPNDGGHLIVEAADYERVISDPVAARYLRPFVGAKELLHNLPRWCLWLEDLAARDLEKSLVLKFRVEQVRQYRLASTRAETRALAATPHLFAERRQPNQPYLAIPKTSSETRPYLPCALLSPNVISSDLNFTAVDHDGHLFAVVSSKMFITWMRTVGGRLKSDLRFSADPVWNAFPLPETSDAVRTRLAAAGRVVLAARAEHPARTLAEHYHPLAMDPALVHAHNDLDRIVDRLFGLGRAPSERDRQRALFEHYSTAASGLLTTKPGRRRFP